MTANEKLLVLKKILTDKHRKSILLILKDLIELKKTHSFSELKFYFRSLMFKEDAGDIHKYVNDNVLLRILKFNSQQGSWYSLANKIIFSQIMSALPGSVPLYLGKIENGFMYDSNNNRTPVNNKAELLPILKELVVKYKVIFVKKVVSFGGKDVFRFNDLSFFNLDNLNLDEDYIVQKGLNQHNTLNKINPSCVNTLRVISLNRTGKVKIPNCVLKMGVDGSHNDNIATGGIFVSYDIEQNKLEEIALNKWGENFYNHPATQFAFKDQRLPYPEKIIALVTKAAQLFPDRYVIGWDVAYTPDGPVIIEGNTGPCPLGMQIALRGLRNNKIYDEIYREFYN